jgi:hypothetical protein
MSDDYKVDGLSNAKVRALGKRAREYLKLADKDFVEVLDLESETEIWTVLGPKPFRFEAVSDSELPDDSGLTTYDGSRILVRIPGRVRHDALLGHGYARFTIARTGARHPTPPPTAARRIDAAATVWKRQARLDTKVPVGRTPGDGLRSRVSYQ